MSALTEGLALDTIRAAGIANKHLVPLLIRWGCPLTAAALQDRWMREVDTAVALADPAPPGMRSLPGVRTYRVGVDTDWPAQPNPDRAVA